MASLIAQADGRQFVFRKGIGGQSLVPSVCNAYEFDDAAPDASRIFKVKEVLYIESDAGPDIAFLQVDRRTDGTPFDRRMILVSWQRRQLVMFLEDLRERSEPFEEPGRVETPIAKREATNSVWLAGVTSVPTGV